LRRLGYFDDTRGRQEATMAELSVETPPLSVFPFFLFPDPICSPSSSLDIAQIPFSASNLLAHSSFMAVQLYLLFIPVLVIANPLESQRPSRTHPQGAAMAPISMLEVRNLFAT